MVTCLRNLFFSCLFSSAAFSQAAGLMDGKLEDGIAFVTSEKGEVRLTQSNGKTQQPEHHATLTLTGTTVTTGQDGSVFFSLSNETAFSVNENSEVRYEVYQQEPFPKEKENLEYEPSRSKLVIHLVRGSLCFSAEHLSPLSEIIIQLPNGMIKVHKASGRIQYDSRGTTVSIMKGIVTYDYPEVEEQEYISGPSEVYISEKNAKLGRIERKTDETSEPLGELTKRLINATHWSNDRVIFRVPTETEAAIPQPVLVARKKDLQKPTPRPYRYLDE